MYLYRYLGVPNAIEVVKNLSVQHIKYIEERIYPPSTVIQASIILMMSRDDEVSQHVNSTKILRQKIPKTEIIFDRGNNGMVSDIRTRKEDN